MTPLTPVGVVLAGGASRRMGSDKSLLEVDGVAMAARVAAALAGGGCHPVVCQGGDTQALAELGLTVVQDSQPGSGPLAAILDALRGQPGDVVVCACDLPWLDAATVAQLIAVAADRSAAEVVVARDAHGPHLAAFWRSGADVHLGRLVADGMRSYRTALERLEAVAVDVPPAMVVNVNTPEDLGRHR